MKTKIFALLILAMIVLSIIGYSYACRNGGIQINCYYNCDVEFTEVTTSDNEIEKEVANVYAEICDGDKINAYITNAYPCYEAYIDFTIKNKGNKPVHIDEVRIEDYDKTALEISIIDIIACTWISPGETINGQVTVHILQEAKQNWQYTFKIKIRTTCYPERHPRTIGFWKHQFRVALGEIKGKAQVDPDTLEAYLNQINSSSAVFTFTGTRTEKFQTALDILTPPQRSSMEAKLKAQLLAQLLALWLNYVAGWTGGYKYKGMTAEEIIQGSENALLAGATDKYEYWKDLCDRFNNIS
jgi:hypothetical protein